MMIVLLFLFVPSLAFADGTAPAPTQTALQNLTDQVMAILIPSFVLLVGGLATAILAKVRHKLHLDNAGVITDQWDDLAKKAALRGAEWARQEAKKLEGDKKIPGGAVMETAANWAIDMGVQQGLPEMARKKLEGLIDAQLFKLRIENGDSAADPYGKVANPPPKV
jgi:hypothetical protein